MEKLFPIAGTGVGAHSRQEDRDPRGAGIYYDFFFQNMIDTERALLGPPGSGRQTITGSAIPNPLTNVPGVPAGTPLNFTGNPTAFTGANLMAVLPGIRGGLLS